MYVFGPRAGERAAFGAGFVEFHFTRGVSAFVAAPERHEGVALMWKSLVVPFSLGILLAAGNAHAVCGDVTGEGEVSSADALAVLRSAVGQPQNLTCDCSTAGVCPETGGNNDACEAVDENSLCSDCCDESNDCQAACGAAMVVSCDSDGLNETCAEQLNQAGCGGVCCPGE
jgi:hypothetical protein